MELQTVQNQIVEIRGQKVLLDFILAELYEVETRVLNQAVRRNKDLFPPDFMFQLTRKEWRDNSSQFVMSYLWNRPKQATPLAFTEHGISMLANVLKSARARKTSVAIVRAFIALKSFAFTHKELTIYIQKIERRYDKKFKNVNDAINYLLNKDNARPVGFRITSNE